MRTSKMSYFHAEMYQSLLQLFIDADTNIDLNSSLNSQGYFAFNYMYTREFQNSEFFFKSTSEYYIIF